jgi:hypothetical protein
MTLIEKCTELVKRLGRKRDLVALSSDAAAYQQRLDELLTMRIQLLRLFDFAKLLCQEGVMDRKSMPSTLTSTEKLKVLLLKFSEDARSLLVGNAYQTTRSTVMKFATNLDTLTLDAWHVEYGAQLQTSLEGEFLKLFARATGQPTLEQQLDRLNAELNSLAQDPPRDHTRFEEFRALVRERQALADKFTFPHEVRAFLKGVNSDGASLNLLTEEVRLWLENENVEGSFCIRSCIRSRPGGF